MVMAFEFACPSCHGMLRVEEIAAGGLIRCGGCLTLLRVPGPATSSSTDPALPPSELPSDPADPLLERAEALPLPDEELPRPRRRPPPPPPGRGPLFWIVMVFGVLAIGTCSCCGGIYLLMPGASWRTHESARGGFKVDLPAEPKANMPIPGMKADPNVTVEGAILWKRGEFYAVMYWDILPAKARAQADEALLDSAEQGVEQEPEVRRIVRKETITVSGFHGREIEYVATDGGTYIGRFIVADSRLYALVGGGRFVHPGNVNVRRFLDSFAVTDPKLRPGPARRPLD
jgi:hypothetical protein